MATFDWTKRVLLSREVLLLNQVERKRAMPLTSASESSRWASNQLCKCRRGVRMAKLTERERTMRQIAVFILLILTSGVSLSRGQETDSSRPNGKEPTQSRELSGDLAAIHAESQTFVAAFNKGDAKAVAALWTEDGEYIDDTGRSFVGREAIEEGYAEFFAGNPNAKIQITIDSLRLLSDDTAIEDGRAVAEPPPPALRESASTRSSTSRWTANG